MQLGNIPYLKEMVDLGLTPVNGIFILGIVTLWKSWQKRMATVEGHADKCEKDRKELSKQLVTLSKEVGESKAEASAAKLEASHAHLEAGKATLAAASPCHLGSCPKRMNPPTASFSIGESPT